MKHLALFGFFGLPVLFTVSAAQAINQAALDVGIVAMSAEPFTLDDMNDFVQDIKVDVAKTMASKKVKSYRKTIIVIDDFYENAMPACYLVDVSTERKIAINNTFRELSILLNQLVSSIDGKGGIGGKDAALFSSVRKQAVDLDMKIKNSLLDLNK